jgi:octaprenyl-diphosphate synthase
LAFQIVDDILDLIADADTLGKTAGIDLAQGKGLGSVYATNGQHNGTAVAEAVETKPTDDPLTTIKRKILRGDAISEGRMQARLLAQQAINTLDVLPESVIKNELIELANAVVDRNH